MFNSYLLYLTGNKILSDHQHGFRSGQFCETSLTMIYEHLVNNIKNGEFYSVLMLDFFKSYSIIPFCLKKSRHTRATDQTLKWFTPYLEGGTQQVQVNDHMSDPLTIFTGVPQGSILDPLLLLIIINDLPSFLNSSKPSFFTNDSTLLTHGSGLSVIKTFL